MNLDNDLKRLATAAATNWPEIALSGRLDAAIRDLYRTHLPFPPSWTPDERDEFIEEHAEMDAQQLVSRFDDLIDVVIDGFGWQNGYLPHSEDASAMIAEARKDAVYELEASIEYLSDDLAQRAIHTAGRTAASMTGCSPAGRRSRRRSRHTSR
ncbi:transposase [Mycobacterium kyorinense]|uniref:Transposase n=1 Tax=Mycobacterium kyorinense TaxID=487514 RepID=A0A1A2Z2N5_9MYCO|nr:transposase [Mycobacterium kyorinense]OBI43933.1 transposase [Mycobacterium kyorinense]